jgi:hypothetical protein
MNYLSPLRTYANCGAVTRPRSRTVLNGSGRPHRYLRISPWYREGTRHRRLARRRGTAKACVATGNTQLKVYHKLLSNPGTRYQDLGPDYYERQRDTRRQIAHHIGKLGALGFEVTLCRIPEPDPDGSGPAQAA